MKVAIIGGDGRIPGDLQRQGYKDAVVFPCMSWHESTIVRKLRSSLRSQNWDLVIILSKFIGHSMSKYSRRLCKKRGIPVLFA